MSHLVNKLIKVNRTGCGAKIGERCSTDSSVYFLFCKERYDLIEKLFPTKINLPKEVKSTPFGASSVCSRNMHDNCSGFTARKHGIRPKCTCRCHLVKK